MKPKIHRCPVCRRAYALTSNGARVNVYTSRVKGTSRLCSADCRIASRYMRASQPVRAIVAVVSDARMARMRRADDRGRPAACASRD